MARLTDQILQSAPVRFALARSSAAIDIADRWLGRQPNWIFAVACLAALQGALILTHWPWLDEWQGLQIAVQSPDLPALMRNLRYEGHPPLWYLILRYSAGIVPSLWVLAAVALALAALTQGLILFASPFTRAERLTIGASQFILFEMMTVSRGFTLGTALIVLTLALWRRRWAWLGIALLPMCDFLYGVVSLAFIALKWRGKALWWPGLAAWLVISLAAAWSVRLPPDVVPALATDNPLQGLGIFLSNLGLDFLPFQWTAYHPQWNSRPPLLLLPIAWIGFLWFALIQTRHERWNRIILFGLMAVMLAMSMAVYLLSFRHVVLVAVMLIGLAWIDLAEGRKRPDAGMRLWLLGAAGCGLFTAAVNFAEPFDRAHVAVREIEARGLEHERWLAFPLSHARGIPALSGIAFENPSFDCVQSFVPWTSDFFPDSREEAIGYLRARVAREGRFYMVTNLHLAGFPKDLVQPVALIPPGYDGLAYELYLVGPGAPKKPADKPQCVPGTREFRALP